MAYTIEYYSSRVQQELLALPVTLQARYVALSLRMQENGPDLGKQHSLALGQGLFELRLTGAEGIARVLYCTLVGRRIVVLHSFIKKTQKTPQRDLAIGRARLKEVKNAHA